MRRYSLVLAAMVGWCVLSGTAAAQLRVWTVTDTRRVLREDSPQGAVSEPALAQLAAARNEWRSFQILLRSDAALGGVRVEAGDLTGPGGAVLGGSWAKIFRQHALHLTEPSNRNDAFRPGWYPDALIPATHPLSGKPLAAKPLAGARFVAMPFDLPLGETHGFWVDLFVPSDARPGVYRGTYRVVAEGQSREVAVTLSVWDFALPDTPTMQTSFGSPLDSVRRYCEKKSKAGLKTPFDAQAAQLQICQLLSDHRFNATPEVNLAPVAQPDGTYRVAAESIDALRRFVDRYHVNAVMTPHPSIVVKDPVAERAKLRAWLSAWDRAAADLARPQVVFYTYLLDEPNDKEAYQYVQKWGRAVREARSALKVLVVEQTLTQDAGWGDLNGAIDIWCPLFGLHDEPTAAKRRALGETIWTYTALCQCAPKSPFWQTDFPLLHYRVPAWTAWRYRMQGLLYWGGMAFWDHVDDVWTDPKTYNLRKGSQGGQGSQGQGPIFQGEGSLVYPGADAGYDGVASSLRLKALRDSIQDYEYLAILQRLGRTAEAEKIVLPLTDSFFRWNPNPKAYDTARAKLAELIVAAQKQSPMPAAK